MDRLMASARLMIVSDLDHTMVDHHDTENMSLLRFNSLWEAHYRQNSILVFSTGRSPLLYNKLRMEKPMLTPDITIMSVGTEIMYGNSMTPDEGWVQILNENWDRNVVFEETSKLPNLKPQPETEQRPHKVSFYVDKDKVQDVIAQLSETLEKKGLDVKIIYSGGIDLDVLPQGAGKGQALAYLHKKLTASGKLPQNTLVCGDSGNDAELFAVPDVHGVMVNNAQEELLQWYDENAKNNPKVIHASKRCAAGIIEAIGHFNLGPCTPLRDFDSTKESSIENSTVNFALVSFFLLYEKYRRGEIDESSSLKGYCDACGTLVHPCGTESPIVGVLEKAFGDQKGKPYRVWVDQVSPTKVGPDFWVVKMKKWELWGGQRAGCVVTVLLNFKDGSALNANLLHVHETWIGDSRERSWVL